jgi:antitoxin VapB
VSLNLKNPRAHELASQLAALTGESLTSAVIRALEERLESEMRRKGQMGVAERMLDFSDRFAGGMPRNVTSADHAGLLFGEDGLPR